MSKTLTIPQPNWEKEFDRRFTSKYGHERAQNKREIKSFIHTTITQAIEEERSRIREEITELHRRSNIHDDVYEDLISNAALSVLDSLTKKE